MSLTCEEVGQKIRSAAIGQLVTEVNKREDMFLVEGGEYARNDEGWESWVNRPELNPYAIAEWTWDLLERQRAAMIEAVERALNDTDNDNEE